MKVPRTFKFPGLLSYWCSLPWASQLVLVVKSPSAETWVGSLVWEDPLKEGMVTHSRILAWRIPWTEEPGGWQSMGSQRVRHNWSACTFSPIIFSIPERSKGPFNKALLEDYYMWDVVSALKKLPSGWEDRCVGTSIWKMMWQQWFGGGNEQVL